MVTSISSWRRTLYRINSLTRSKISQVKRLKFHRKFSLSPFKIIFVRDDFASYPNINWIESLLHRSKVIFHKKTHTCIKLFILNFSISHKNSFINFHGNKSINWSSSHYQQFSNKSQSFFIPFFQNSSCEIPLKCHFTKMTVVCLLKNIIKLIEIWDIDLLIETFYFFSKLTKYLPYRKILMKKKS